MVRRAVFPAGKIPELVMETALTLPPAPATCGISADKPARAHSLARLASQALIEEAELTPKPGLVDRRGPGSHTDLSLPLMRRSAFAIEPYFREMARISIEAEPDFGIREALGAIGRKAERAMYAATGGSNSHKGAIWSLGLLISAAAMQNKRQAPLICRTAATIASHKDQYAPVESSHGRLVAQKYRVAGARDEAIAGFPHIIRIGLPLLRAKRFAGVSEVAARLDALLGIMSRLPDTCVLYREGWAALRSVQHGAAAVVTAGGCETSTGRRRFHDLDLRLRTLGLSPGGSADLLAATLFLDAVEREATTVPQQKSETLHGND